MPKHKITIEGTVPVVFLKEGDTFIAHCPVLDLSSCGATYEEADRNFAEALEILITECVEKDSLFETFSAYGWTLVNEDNTSRLSPPLYVGDRQVKVPQIA